MVGDGESSTIRFDDQVRHGMALSTYGDDADEETHNHEARDEGEGHVVKDRKVESLGTGSAGARAQVRGVVSRVRVEEGARVSRIWRAGTGESN